MAKGTYYTRGSGFLEKFLSKKRSSVADSLIQDKMRSGKILDIGYGVFPYFLHNIKFGEKFAIEKNIDGLKLNHKNIIFSRCDVEKEKIPHDDNYFDVVAMLAVVEHLEPKSLVNILTEVRRVLKKDGVLIFTTPAKWTRFILEMMSFLGLVSREEISEHTRQYTHKELTEILIKAGYKNENIELGYFELFMNIYGRVSKH